MKKIANYWPLILLFFLTLITNLQIGLFGDDYFYASFSKLGFWQMHIKHYLESNGRALVHFLDSLFLILPQPIWAIFNSFCLCAIAYFACKIITLVKASSKHTFQTLLLFTILILAIPIKVARQSIYWKTGSMNYVFPMFLFFLYWYVLLKSFLSHFQKGKLLVILLAFISSLTVEQEGMMTFGVTLLLLIYYLWKKKQYHFIPIKPLILILTSSLTGLCTLLLAPSQFTRIQLEHANDSSLFSSAKEYYHFLIDTFLFSKEYRLHIFIGLFLLLAFIITLSKRPPLNTEERFVFFTTIILAIGSQVMLIITTSYGERTTLPAIIMLAFLSCLILSFFPSTQMKWLSICKQLLASSLLTIAIFHSITMSQNYHHSNMIQKQNIAKIHSYIDATEKKYLILQRIDNDDYSWSMPYNSNYHSYWFEKYYQIENAKIIWN